MRGDKDSLGQTEILCPIFMKIKLVYETAYTDTRLLILNSISICSVQMLRSQERLITVLIKI